MNKTNESFLKCLFNTLFRIILSACAIYGFVFEIKSIPIILSFLMLHWYCKYMIKKTSNSDGYINQNLVSDFFELINKTDNPAKRFNYWINCAEKILTLAAGISVAVYLFKNPKFDNFVGIIILNITTPVIVIMFFHFIFKLCFSIISIEIKHPCLIHLGKIISIMKKNLYSFLYKLKIAKKVQDDEYEPQTYAIVCLFSIIPTFLILFLIEIGSAFAPSIPQDNFNLICKHKFQNIDKLGDNIYLSQCENA